jgi:DNA-binding LacI/PurR family transcriptional regulator
MKPVHRLSVPELIAAHLREGLREGHWSGTLPGVARLAVELDVSQYTIRRALKHLEAEGLLDARGLGRSRSITAATAAETVRLPMRVGILCHDEHIADSPVSSLVLNEIKNSLKAAGHTAFFFTKSQIELRRDLQRISNHLATHPADAWVIEAGSRPLLEWCAQQPVPCIALYGRTDGLSLARTGPDKVPAYIAATRQLLALGHRRIVLITRESRRKPAPSNCESAFLDELKAHGIPTGDYNLPDWEETPEGFSRLLTKLFCHTPPTALIIDESCRYIAAAEFLARNRLHVPDQVSLVSTDENAVLSWCHPGIAHMTWDKAPVVRRVVRWVAAVRKGSADHTTINNVTAKFIPGASIGPVWKG